MFMENSLMKFFILLLVMLLNISIGTSVLIARDPKKEVKISSEQLVTLKINFLAKRKAYRKDEPIFIKASICNQSKEPIFIVPVLVAQNYFIHFTIKDSDENEIPYKGKTWRLIIPKRQKFIKGQCLSETFDISSLFSLPDHGNLKIEGTYHDNLTDVYNSKIILTSNMLSLTITN